MLRRRCVSEEEELDGDGQRSVEHDDENQKELAGLLIGGAEDWVQVAQQEGNAEAEADADEDPVQQCEGRPGDQGDGNPDEIRVAIQRPALKEVSGLAAGIFQSEEEGDRDHKGVAVYEACGAFSQCQ